MAWSQVSKFKNMVIAVNGATVYEGDLQVPLLPTDIFNRAAARLGNGSQNISQGDFVFMYRYYEAPDITWASYDVMVLTAGPYSDSASLFDLVHNIGDIITIYNKTIGPQNALRFRFASSSGGYRDFYVGIISNGVLYEDGVNATLQTYRSSSRYRLGYWGIIFDPDLHKAMIWNSRSVIDIPPGDYDIAAFQYTPAYNAPQTVALYGLYSAFAEYDSGGGGGGDPYVSDDYDTSVGGNDDPDDTSDTITEDSLPTISATVSGLCTAYVPTLTQMQALANQLVDPTWYQALGSTVLNVSDVVIGLQVLPFVVPSTLSQNQWKLNFLGISLPSGLYLNKANQQFCEIPCGTIHVTPYWNNCLDYNPYTQISVFLPFCGFFELDTDDVMDHDLEIKYRVDIMSGACLATIKVDGSIMYQFAGECGNQIPVSSVSFDNFLQSAMQLAITTASGSIGLAAAGASATMQKEKIAMSDMSAGDKQIAEDAVNTELKFKKSQNGVGLLAATAGAVISAKGQYKHAGCIAGSPGFLGVRKPYLIIKRPKQIMPSLYGDFRGYPTNTVMKLSDCHGYTEVDSIRLNIPNATVDEIYECETLLKEGVVFD